MAVPVFRARLVAGEDLIAQSDALGADVHAWPGEQPSAVPPGLPQNEHAPRAALLRLRRRCLLGLT